MIIHLKNKLSIGDKLVSPVLASICTLMMLVLNWFCPVAHLLRSPYNLAGLLVLGAGLAISFAARGQFKKKRANFYPFEDPTGLITDGLFRYSRNPMYLGLTIFLAGVGMFFGSLSPLGVAVTFFLVADRWYVAYEEQRLACLFGTAYAAYRARTPRWFSLSLNGKRIGS